MIHLDPNWPLDLCMVTNAGMILLKQVHFAVQTQDIQRCTCASPWLQFGLSWKVQVKMCHPPESAAFCEDMWHIKEHMARGPSGRQLAIVGARAAGVVRTNVGQQVTLITLCKGYFCTKFYIRWSRDITSPSTTTQINNKHHHHGDGAARPSSGVDSMTPHRLSGGRPCSFLFQGRCQRVLVESIN